MSTNLGIIGRERAIVDRVGKALHREAQTLGDFTAWRETARGGYFELDVHVDAEATGHIVRVTVELDRIGQ